MEKTDIWPAENSTSDVRIGSIVSDLDRRHGCLFTRPGGVVEVEVAEATTKGCEGFFLESFKELQEHLGAFINPTDPEVTSSFDALAHRASFLSVLKTGVSKAAFRRFSHSYPSFLEPAYGWGHIPITQDAMQKLLASLGVFHNAYRYICAFGRKEFAQDEAFAGFDSVVTLDNEGTWASLESCYLLKYIGKNSYATPGSIPWSIRHAMIYQKTDADARRTTQLLIRLPEAAKQQMHISLMGESTPTRFVESWTNIHATCFEGIDDEVRQFINYLDAEVAKVFERMISSGVQPDQLNDFDTIQTSATDLKNLQCLSDQARRVMSVLELNIKTMKCLQDQLNSLITRSPPGSKVIRDIEALAECLKEYLREHSFSMINAQVVLDRSQATSQQLRDTVMLRNGEINKLQAQMANENTLATVRLADRSSQEAHVVKSLTVLALVFVPASFVADFLQMGYITTTRETPLTWSATADLQIYAILAIPLIFVTMMIYVCVERYKRRRNLKLGESFGDSQV